MLFTIIALIFLIIIILCIVKPKYGLALFLVYFFLVPIIKFQFGGISIGEKFLFMIVSFSYLIRNHYKLKKSFIIPFKPFIFLYLSLCMLVLFQSQLQAMSIELIFMRILGDLLFPFSLYCLMKLEPESTTLLNKAFLISIIIIIIYGLILTLTPGINPYLMLILPSFGLEFNEAYALGHSGLSTATNLSVVDGRMFGRISSVFIHPMQYGLFLSLSIVYCFSCIKSNRISRYIILFLILIAILTSGVRSSIGAILCTLLVIILKNGKITLAFKLIIGVSVLLGFIYIYSPQMFEYLSSIVTSPDKTEVKGSSLSMRLEQLVACFDVIKESPLTGNGYAWSSNYLATKTIHPKLLAFESLLYVVLCDTGYIGILIWCIFIYKYVRFITKFADKRMKLTLLALYIIYISYSCITGEYNYMKYFMIFYILILCNFENKKIGTTL